MRPPARRFSLVVNVSAPEGSGLDYEHESYRLTLALTQHCTLTATELGSLDDLAETVQRVRPTGIHFSGYGGPGQLQFEDDEGRDHTVKVAELVEHLRKSHPEGLLPPFFYLANCHGNDPVAIEEGRAGVESLAARLHGEGVAQVVAYSGPILDVLSTEAEAALYAGIASGHTTRFAVRQAREALARPLEPSRSVLRQRDPRAAESMRESHPFAWSQLVLYHRGPDHPLSPPAPRGQSQRGDEPPRRTFLDAGTRRILATGFIGRRSDLHRLRRKVRAGQTVFVLQGLGGLGKSTLALHTLKEILHAQDDLCILWCQDAEKAGMPAGIAQNLVGQLLEFCRRRLGAAWEAVVHQVDRAAGDDPAQRFGLFLQVLAGNIERLVVYLDNLESLLVGPDEVVPADSAAFGQWRSPALKAIWGILKDFAQDTRKLVLVASCRYRNDDFGKALIPVGPLPAGALFRLMGWFPGLRRLTVASRALLAAKLDGHPRAIEFANDLVEHALDAWEGKVGREWTPPAEPASGPEPPDWAEIVAPALPQVAEKLDDDLLFGAIWDHVLDDRGRRMLDRMTLLRRPWELSLERELGEPGEPLEMADATAARLRRTSLLEQVDLMMRDGLARHEAIHPATAQFVARRFGDDRALRQVAHGRIGAFYEAKSNTSPYIDDRIEAGHHLLQAGEYNRACDLLGPASEWLWQHGRVREGLHVLGPFLDEAVRPAMTPKRAAGLLGTVGLAYNLLGQVDRAIAYHERTLQIVRDIGDRQAEGAVLGNLGNACRNLGQVDRAIDYYKQTLAIHREVGDRQGEGFSLGNLGIAYALLGQMERAIRFNEQALEIVHEIGDRRCEALNLGNLGIAYAALGQLEQAIAYYLKQLVIVREIGDRHGEGTALGNLGTAYTDLGQVERAIDYHDKRLEIAREIGDRRGEGTALGNLGTAFARLGQLERAIDYYDKRLEIAREIRDRRGEGTALGNLGAAYVDLGQVERAIDSLVRALRIGEEIKDPSIIRSVTANLERLRGTGSNENPENASI